MRPMSRTLGLITVAVLAATTAMTGPVAQAESDRLTESLSAPASTPVSEVPAVEEPARWIIGVDPEGIDLGLGVRAADLDSPLSDQVAQTLLAGTLAGLGHEVTDRYEQMPYLVIETTDEVTEADLSGLPGVESVTRDIRLERALSGALTAIQATDADLNTAIGGTRADGSGRIVVIVDDGIDRTHPFFGGASTRVTKELCVNREDCLNAKEGIGVAAHYAGDWHGTHVAGIAAGAGGPANVPRGVAQAATIWAAKVFNADGGASVTDINRALQWVYDQVSGPNASADVAAINMSLGGMIGSNATCDAYSPSTTTLVHNLVAAGVAVVIAAGNSADDFDLAWPACISQATAVGATNSEIAAPQITSFTNLSSTLSASGLMAPGSSICSSFDRRVSEYGCASGTSMAAPIVAGAMAVLSQVSASASPPVMQQALYDTGTPTVAYRNLQYQRINLAPAITEMGVPSGSLQLTVRDLSADVGDVPLSSQPVNVTLDDHNFGQPRISVTAQTSPTGVFTLPGIPLGTWNVTVSATGYQATTAAVTISNGLTTALTAQISTPTGAISGTFASDPGEATFMLTPTGSNPWPAQYLTRNPVGTSFTLTDIRTGDWTLQVAAGVSISAAVPVTVQDSLTAAVGELELIVPIGSIVLDAETAFDNTAFAGALTVVATPVGEPVARVARTVTVPAGPRMTLGQMVAGEWSLAVSGTAHLATTTSVTVAQNQTSAVTVSLQPAPRDVIGVVTLPGGSGITNDLLTITPEVRAPLPAHSQRSFTPATAAGQISFSLQPDAGGQALTRTSSLISGTYRLIDVPAGSYQATVTTFGYVTDSALALSVPPGETSVELSFSMNPRAETAGISRSSGSTAGGESVVISGVHFAGVSTFFGAVDEVRFGSTSVTTFVISPDGRSLSLRAPAGSAGTVTVQVYRGGVPLLGSLSYTYSAPPPPPPSFDGGGGGGGGGGGSTPAVGEPVVAPVPAPAAGGVARMPVTIPAGELELGFSGLSGAGAEIRVEAKAGPPDQGAEGVTLIGGHLDIMLVGASFREVELCVPYRAADVAAAGVSTADLRLVHFVGDFGRADITTEIDTVRSRVCGVTTGFSPFGIGVMNTRRTFGNNRYETAAQISVENFSSGVPVVYLANGQRFPDALAAAAAAAREGGPVLLTEAGRLPASTRTELIRLRPALVLIVGGTAAVNSVVEQAVRVAVPTAEVRRRQGEDRYDTAVEISRASFAPGLARVYVATGLSFPDALAGAAAAGREGAPVLLVPGSGSAAGVPAVVAGELARLQPSEVVILGGTSAISAAVSTRIGQILPATTRTRIEGRDRYATAARLAAPCTGTGRVYAATGVEFADALAGAVAAARDGCPLVLVPMHGMTTEVRDLMSSLQPRDIVILGGTVAINDQSESALASYLR